MKNFYEIKTVADSTLDVDDKSRRVKVVLNKTGVKDFDRDIIDKSAFNKTISERGPGGKNLIWHLTDHTPSLKSAVGKFSELGMKGDDLIGVTDISDTSWGNDVLTFYKSGQINQHSIGFRTIKREVMNEDNPAERYDILKEVMLYEGSAVLWGANEFTPTLSVGKSQDVVKCPKCGQVTKNMESGMGYIMCEKCNEIFSSQDAEYLKTKYFSLKKEFDSGNYTDEFFLIIESQLKQIEQLIIEQFTEPKTITQPKEEELLMALQLLKLKL